MRRTYISDIPGDDSCMSLRQVENAKHSDVKIRIPNCHKTTNTRRYSALPNVCLRRDVTVFRMFCYGKQT